MLCPQASTLGIGEITPPTPTGSSHHSKRRSHRQSLSRGLCHEALVDARSNKETDTRQRKHYDAIRDEMQCEKMQWDRTLDRKYKACNSGYCEHRAETELSLHFASLEQRVDGCDGQACENHRHNDVQDK
jgi:hypothetical protein